jgi:hypothetical protein
MSAMAVLREQKTVGRQVFRLSQATSKIAPAGFVARESSA